MISSITASLFLSSLFVSVTFGHSMVQKVWADGVEYNGWDPNGNLSAYPSTTPAWFTTNTGGKPLNPIDLNQRPIICALGGSNANFSAPVTSGSNVRVRWWQADQTWPRGHHGPIVDYLAPCNGSCAKVKPESLKFVKIAQRGWINGTSPGNDNEGFWATDELIADDGHWNIRIPKDLLRGEYVLRTEIVALHAAYMSTGAYSKVGGEFYPQCVSLKVEGNGTQVISGGLDARSFYRGDEKGLTLNIHTNGPSFPDYLVPGPSVWSGAA